MTKTTPKNARNNQNNKYQDLS